MIDVVVPSLRKDTVQRLIHSLSLGTQKPGAVSVVSNEIDTLDTYGLNVRLIRFTSDYYPVGYKDVALRCNVGIWASEADMVFISGDDQIASPTTIEDGAQLLLKKPYWWGHHRLTSFKDKSVEEVMAMHPSMGRSRETAIPAWHLYQSCYSGSFAFRRKVVEEIGGFDMLFNCRHGGEDQNIGLRLAWKYEQTNRVYIHEPPYWWHSTDADPWVTPEYSNLCDSHELREESYSGYKFEFCDNCPYYRYIGPEELLFSSSKAIMPYDNDRIKVRIDRPIDGLVKPHG